MFLVTNYYDQRVATPIFMFIALGVRVKTKKVRYLSKFVENQSNWRTFGL